MLEGLVVGEGRALSVEVPASTSNLGPGFDLLGLALSLRLEVTARKGDGSGTRTLTTPHDWPEPAEDLLVAAFDRATTSFGGIGGGWTLEATSEIPVGRGLGSSAAAIVAGLLLGAALAPGSATRDEILALALALEGHPDNVSPALLGGCVMALPRAGQAPRTVDVELHASLAFAVAWPETRLATSFARNLLPLEVPFADAVENPRRLGLLLEGLRRGDRELLQLGSVDRLHVPYRLGHVPGGEAGIAAAHAAGAFLATLSGSGTALFAISDTERIAGVADAMAAAFRDVGEQAVGRVVEVVHRPSEPVVV